MHGLYLLWWVQEKNLSPAVVATILAAGNLFLLVAELPTGWFADRFGHRTSLVLGSLVQVVGMLWCWLGEGVGGLVTASVLIALGDGFRSGATQALLYRTCLALDGEAQFQTLESRATAVETAALTGMVLAGGAIVSVWGFAAGWIAETALCLVGLGIACAMTEPPAAADADDSSPPDDPRAGAPARQLVAVILPAALLGGAAEAASFLAQTATGADPVSATWLVAAITLAEAAGAAAASRFTADGRTQAGLLLLGVPCAVAACFSQYAFFIGVPLLAFLDGLSHPLRATQIQRLAGDGVRARLASLASAVDMAVSTITLPLTGMAAARRRRR